MAWSSESESSILIEDKTDLQIDSTIVENHPYVRRLFPYPKPINNSTMQLSITLRSFILNERFRHELRWNWISSFKQG
ncbi:hypothetical protein J1614_007346 [Plenodomus biglobosus]|nr:hypothetical protein J1614_007346 [Plenodomus biglobosus]